MDLQERQLKAAIALHFLRTWPSLLLVSLSIELIFKDKFWTVVFMEIQVPFNPKSLVPPLK